MNATIRPSLSRRETRPRSPWRAVLQWMALASLLLTACWSSDTLFIKLTPTPIPSPTPVPVAIDSLFQIGDTALIVSQGIAPVYLTVNPEPVTRRNRVPNAACYANARVQIEAVERVDDVTYYRVTCSNASGWLAESNLREIEDA